MSNISTVPTTLLPLEVSRYLWDDPPDANPRTGGGLDLVDDVVLGVDRWGRFFTYRTGGRIDLLDARIETGRAGVEAQATSIAQLEAESLDVHDLVGRGLDPDDPRTFNLRSFRFLDLAVLPEGPGLRLAVSHYRWSEAGQCKSLVVSMARVSDRTALLRGAMSLGPDAWSTVFDADRCFPFSYRNASSFQSPNGGGALLFADGYHLLMALGDHHLDGVNAPEEVAQDPRSPLGKVVEIDLRTGEHRVLASGLRDPQGLIRDAHDSIWVTDVGPQGGDELNRIDVENPNLGWPRGTFGTDYGAQAWPLAPEPGRHDGFHQPMLAWIPSINVSRLIQIGSSPSRWSGDLLVAAFNGQLHRIRVGEGRILLDESIPVDIRVRDLVQMEDGAILLWSDDGRTFAEVREGRGPVVPPGAPAAFASCLSCHSYAGGVGPSAPDLGGLSSRGIASTDFGYSEGLREVGGRWTRTSLLAFLRSPSSFAPGTTMPQPDIGSAAVLDSIVNFLIGHR